MLPTGKIPKLLSLLLTFSLSGTSLFSQSLEGIWNGNFTAYIPGTQTVNEIWFNKMKLEIVLNADSTYDIYSHCGDPFVRSDRTNRICKTSYLMDGSSIFIQESVVLYPANGTACFKSMTLNLTIKKNTMTLRGPWTTSSATCFDAGEIQLTKNVKPGPVIKR